MSAVSVWRYPLSLRTNTHRFVDQQGKQMRALGLRQLVATGLAAMLMLGATAAISVTSPLPIGSLTRDVTAVAKLHPLTGLLSNLGILLWCSTASICLFAAWIARRQSRPQAAFLLCSGLLSAYLMADDLLLIHEDLARRYLGVGERLIFLLLALMVGAYLLRFAATIWQTRCVGLMLAFACLGGSVLVDQLRGAWAWRLGEWYFLLEDGLKWLGIVFWFSYFASICAAVLRDSRPAIEQSLQPASAFDRGEIDWLLSVQNRRVINDSDTHQEDDHGAVGQHPSAHGGRSRTISH